MSNAWGQTLHWIKRLLFDPRFFWLVSGCVILCDAVLSQLIIRKIAFTEIDWETYMYQVDLFIKGERDYSKISGPSGPLVYPAGHVYIHYFLSKFTDSGLDLRKAQNIYWILYLITVFLVCTIYRRGGLPNYVVLLLPLSKRLHSIFVLRLFNDCWAVVLSQVAVLTYCTGWDDLATVLFSFAISVKMSVLLYWPGILIILFRRRGLLGILRHLLWFTTIQLVVAFPFIQSFPQSYLFSAFEFSRAFLYKWTVNWRFVPEPLFLSKTWASSLLVGHLCVLSLFAFFKWCQRDGGSMALFFRGLKHPMLPAGIQAISADEVITILFTSNLIGITFARSLHYQFYSWYAQQLPFLLWRTKYPIFLRVLLLVCIEWAWNIFPSTNVSSGLLLVSNVLCLLGVWTGDSEGKRDFVEKTK